MIIARNIIAILLETQPSNIKSLKQVDNNIHIQLKNSPSELSMTVQEYQNCQRQLRKNKAHINYTNFLTIAAIIGMFVFAAISSVETTNVISDNNNQTGGQLITDY